MCLFNALVCILLWCCHLYWNVLVSARTKMFPVLFDNVNPKKPKCLSSSHYSLFSLWYSCIHTVWRANISDNRKDHIFMNMFFLLWDNTITGNCAINRFTKSKAGLLEIVIFLGPNWPTCNQNVFAFPLLAEPGVAHAWAVGPTLVVP